MTPRLAPLLLLALLAPGVAPVARAQEEPPAVSLSLSHARIDMGPGFDAWVVLDATVGNPNGFAVEAELLVEDAPEEGVMGLSFSSFSPVRLAPGEARVFRVNMAGPVESAGDHALTVKVAGNRVSDLTVMVPPATLATAALPLRLHSPDEWADLTTAPGARSFTVHSVGDPAFFEPGAPVRLDAEVEGEGAPATLVAEVVDPEGRFAKARPARILLFPGQRLHVVFHAVTAPDAPREFEASLRLRLEDDPASAQTLPVAMRPPTPGEEPPAPTPATPSRPVNPGGLPVHDTTFADGVLVQAPEGPLRVAPGERVAFALRVTNGGPRMFPVETHGPNLHRNVSGEIRWGDRAPGWSAQFTPSRVEARPGADHVLLAEVSAPADARPGERLVAYGSVAILGGGVDVASRQYQLDVLVVEPAPPSPGPADASGDAPGGPLRVPAAALAAGLLLAAGGLAAALLARREAWRWTFLAPLSTRISRGRTLDHETRRSLLRIVAASPGIHYRELKRRTELNTGTLVHHLRALEQAGHLVSRREGSLRRFYAVGPAPVPPAPVVPRTPVQERILSLLDERPMTQRELAERLGLSQQGLNHHVKTLERKGLLVSQPGEDGVRRWQRAGRPAAER